MSSDQVTYVLIALIVTGIAILLLLAGALLARRARGHGEGRPIAQVPARLTAAPPVAATPEAPPAPTAPATAAPLPAMPVPGEPTRLPVEPAVTSADLEAAARRVDDPREQEVIEGFLSIAPRRREGTALEASRAPSAAGPVVAAIADGEAGAGGPGPAFDDPYVDGATGLDSRTAWDRDLAEENARYVRYRRPVGVVVAELDGLGRFEAQFGPEAAGRILAAVGGAMRRSARRTDRVAHAGGGRFLVLLPETDEIQAINYVERVRGECERWLDAGAVALHLALGWASPSAVGELDTALRTAEERMYTERRRAARTGALDPDAIP